MHKGVSECNDLLVVDCGHRSRRANAEIAVDERHADRLATHKGRIVPRMNSGICSAAGEGQK